LNWKEVLEDSTLMADALVGRQLAPLEGNWKAERRIDESLRKQELLDGLNGVWKELKLDSWAAGRNYKQKFLVSVVNSIALHDEVILEKKRLKRTEEEYACCVGSMLQQVEDIGSDLIDPICVADDKIRTKAWIVSKKCYQALQLMFVVLGAGWTVVKQSAEQVVEEQFMIATKVLSCKMFKFLKVKDWNKRTLPRMFITIKSKCFAKSDSQNSQVDHRSCKELGHSCVRKIISNSMLPAKNEWRSVSRGIEHIAKQALHGFEVWQMKVAGHKVVDGINLLRRNVLPCCRK